MKKRLGAGIWGGGLGMTACAEGDSRLRKSLRLTPASPMSRTMNKYRCLPWSPDHFGNVKMNTNTGSLETGPV